MPDASYPSGVLEYAEFDAWRPSDIAGDAMSPLCR
jgi:hypothetical protein